MAKNKNEDKALEEEKICKVKFLKTYCGEFGVFYKNEIYTLNDKVYNVLKDIVEKL